MAVLVFGDSTVADRLMTYVSVDAETGCWNFTGTRDRNGYGAIRCGRKMRLAHRVSYVLHRGDISIGLHVDHLCRNRACFNPAHLEAVTRQENWRRSQSVTRINADATHCKNGHAFLGRNLYIRTTGARSCRACSLASSRRHKARRRLASLPTVTPVTTEPPTNAGKLF